MEAMGFLGSPPDSCDDRTFQSGQGRRQIARVPEVEGLERRALLSLGSLLPIGTPAAPEPTLSTADVQTLLARAAAATASDNAIVAVVDRGGNILGVRVEGNVSPAITGNTEKLVFSIDGAVAEARTGAFFANDQAPLTSRTVQDIAQSTVTQQEVESDPNVPDPNSTALGPGLVAPIGLKGHFPPRVPFTPQVDLFDIETTNRDSLVQAGTTGTKATSIISLASRFNVPLQFLPSTAQPFTAGAQKNDPSAFHADNAPESYGFASGILPTAQSRGIGTLPGGIPLFKNGHLVGGIGVFFPGTTGFATEENSDLNDAGFFNPLKPDKALEAEFVAFVAAGGSSGAGVSFNTPTINAKRGLPTFPKGDDFDLPFGRIDLVGITLDIFGGHGLQGPKNLVDSGVDLGMGNPNSGVNQPVDPMGDTLLPGTLVPQGWLVIPHDAPDGSLTAADVTAMVQRGVAEANQVRAAIRLPLNSTAKMVFAVSDKQGNILGLYRMPDATYFSIDVAVAKARNVAYYADSTQLQTIDQVSNLPKGVAMTSRTFRYLAEPRFPEGIDGNKAGPFSILNDGPLRVASTGPQPASSFQSVQGYDAFHPNTNFHDPNNLANQNGVAPAARPDQRAEAAGGEDPAGPPHGQARPPQRG
jgi:uncharacterized protein GlcG (DUF336 family)